ncbi:MAG: hypothetical protein ABIS21_08415 [Acidimicrobiales bacterium]
MGCRHRYRGAPPGGPPPLGPGGGVVARLASGGDDGVIGMARADATMVEVRLWPDITGVAVLTASGRARVSDPQRSGVVVRIGLVNYPIAEVPERIDDAAVDEALRSLFSGSAATSP